MVDCEMKQLSSLVMPRSFGPAADSAYTVLICQQHAVGFLGDPKFTL
jgi:hypothetical protein